MLSAAPFRAVLLDSTTSPGAGVTTGTSLPINCKEYPYLVVYYSSIGTTSGGNVIIEEADFSDDPHSDNPYQGTWSQIESRAVSTFTGTVTLAVHLQVAAYGYVRVRISSAVTGGGTIVVVLRGTPS